MRGGITGESKFHDVHGAKLLIADAVDDGIGRHGPEEDDDPDAVQAMKSRTIRIELGDL